VRAGTGVSRLAWSEPKQARAAAVALGEAAQEVSRAMGRVSSLTCHKCNSVDSSQPAGRVIRMQPSQMLDSMTDMSSVLMMTSA
jgi:hypothetical protein